MADVQTAVEVPQEAVAPTDPVVETKATEEAPVAEAAIPAATDAELAVPAVDASAPAETEAAPAEDAKEEVKPVEEGHLEHKGQGANFPKNLIFSKKFVWFGTDAVDTKTIPSFKADKATDVAHHIAAWAAETGKGLLFYSEKSDKTAPTGAILLADASEPATEGTNKFHFTSKGHKHSFKASSTAERDNWVAQLKAKIAEAKELVSAVTESETYKTTLESLKPATVAKKEDKVAAAEPAAEEATPAVAEEAPKDAPEPAKEEPKRRSASRKRASIFGSFLGKKEEKTADKTEDVPAVPTPEEEATPAEATTETAAEAPVAVPEAAFEAGLEAAPVAETTGPAAEVAANAAEEPKAEEKKEETKPVAPKRQSIFSTLSFGKKKVAEPEAVAAPAPATTEAVSETAPVIPAVESTEPLSAEISSPANVPTETVDITPASNGETKKEVKSEKRKSSLPFGFGSKKEKAAGEEEGVKSPGPFSKFRATIKGKGKTEKTAEEVPAVPEAEGEETKETAPAAEEAAKPVEQEAVPVADPVVEEPASKPLETIPTVTAAA